MGRIVYMETYEEYVQRVGESAPKIDKGYKYSLYLIAGSLLAAFLISFYEKVQKTETQIQQYEQHEKTTTSSKRR